MYCIYIITNKINGHQYIGQHKYTDESKPMGRYKGSGILLHKAYEKYGKENFAIEVLYSRIRDKETIDAMEILAIKKYKPEYNIAPGGQGGNFSMFWTEEGKQKIVAACHSPEALRKSSKSNKGKKHKFSHHKSDGYKAYWNSFSKEELGVKIKERGFYCNHKGMHWFNNGELNKLAFSCPEGFIKGRIKKEK